MSANLIGLPPWQKSGGALQDVAFLAKDGILAAQPVGFAALRVRPLALTCTPDCYRSEVESFALMADG
jgi:hypothetical protein